MNLYYLKDKHRNSLLELLQKYKKMLNGTLVKYKGSDYIIELEEDDAKPFPLPKIHELTVKKEVNRLIKLGKINNSQ